MPSLDDLARAFEEAGRNRWKGVAEQLSHVDIINLADTLTGWAMARGVSREWSARLLGWAETMQQPRMRFALAIAACSTSSGSGPGKIGENQNACARPRSMSIVSNIGARPIRSLAAGGLAVAIGLHVAASGWRFNECWPYSAQRQVCVDMPGEPAHGHDRQPGAAETTAAVEWTVSGTGTATG